MIRLARWVVLLADGHLSLVANGDGGEAGWTSLFNETNLDGWGIKCRPADQDKTGPAASFCVRPGSSEFTAKSSRSNCT
jgi:hypothetical protein